MRKGVEQYLVVFGKIMVVIFLFINAWVIYRFYFNFIDSDAASELIFARLLASERRIMSRNWYYSTEISILNSQLIYMPLFWIFSDFKTVRIIGQVIMSCLFLVSYYFCLCSIDRDKAAARFWKTAFLLLIPIGSNWMYLVLWAYYIPYVSVSFLALGIVCRMLNGGGVIGKSKKICLWSAGMILGFTAGLAGIRLLQLTYIPLVMGICGCSWIFMEEHGWDICEGKRMAEKVAGVLSCAAAAFAGYLVNEFVLSRIYHFTSYGEMKYRYFLTSAVQNVINALLDVMGYIGEKSVFSLDGAGNSIALLLTAALIYVILRICIDIKKYKMVEQTVFLFCVLSFCFSIFIYIVINRVIARHIILCLVPMLLLLIILENFADFKQYMLLFFIYAAVIVLGVKEYRSIALRNVNENKRDVIAYIQDRGYAYGYATFWNGNVITELTNGQITFRNLFYDEDTGEITKYNWLTPVSESSEVTPVIGVFLKSELEQMEMDSMPNAVFEDAEYVVYEFETGKELEEILDL